jgi:deferrochelatase/peroxidase EfeB
MDSLITVVAPVSRADLAAIHAAIDALGNPACAPGSTALDATDPDGSGTHFMSLHAFPTGDRDGAHIVFEYTADGTPERALRRIVDAIGTGLEPVFAAATDRRGGGSLYDYLLAHRIGVGHGLFSNPGLCFAGTPGMSVGRIRREAELARFVAGLVDNGQPDMRPIDRLAAIRTAVQANPAYSWALGPPPPPGREGREIDALGGVRLFAWSFIRTFLWPFAAALGAIFLISLVVTRELGDALEATGWGALILLALFVAGAIFLYTRLRKQEESDWTDERALDHKVMAEIRKRENHCAQNHMVSVTMRKPGFVRYLTLRLVFWLIGSLAGTVYRPGFLGGISTIHAARWITVPGTRNLIFFSNFGGSWESYLEDFITRAHAGLTAVWSNSVGFPKAKNLFQDGATDGERFKRYARASMEPTRFWYSAYPDLTTDHVRCNAAMRRGLAAALTNDEAAQWLALFGSAQRPDLKLETSQIQCLLFGGLGFMKDGACLLYNLPEDRAQARAFMAGIHPDIGFGDGRKLRKPAVLTVALGARALEKLGLPDECVQGFPAAFLEGMSTEGRTRILGDTGINAPDQWEWGREPHDLALLAYGQDAGAVAELDARVQALAAGHGMAPPHRIELIRTKKPAIEPFGFVDGVSQPVIRGSYQSFRKNDPIHLVEPGEFVIGYPDNRGNFPPEPTLSPLADPANVLPIADKSREFGNSIVESPRAIGRNGSFLVIRQLEQDVKGFWDYCWSEARRLEDRLPPPYDIRPDFIAAKLVGRWRDGSSLVRNPYYPFPKEQEERAKRRDNRETAQEFSDESAVAASGQPVGSETARPETNPEEGNKISAPAEPSARGDNDFLFGTEDPQALRCPFGAHIRRANPRDSLMPGSMEQVSISNRHRILRVGRLYEPAAGRNPGLLFMCLNGDIERQFEFVQQTWLVSPAFHGLVGEQDPLTSSDDVKGTGYVIPTSDGPVKLKPLPAFVKMLGGGYFFMPGRSLLAFLGGV